jgi:hypothetical protein
MALDRNGERLVVRTAEEAALILASVDWPVRGQAHEVAHDTALKVVDGHRSVADAESSLRIAADEAGFAVTLE